MNINEWNEVLNYIKNRQAVLNNEGVNVKMIPYTVLNKEKGVYVILCDANGNEFLKLASGIHNNIDGLIKGIEKQITRIKKENQTP